VLPPGYDDSMTLPLKFLSSGRTPPEPKKTGLIPTVLPFFEIKDFSKRSHKELFSSPLTSRGQEDYPRNPRPRRIPGGLQGAPSFPLCFLASGDNPAAKFSLFLPPRLPLPSLSRPALLRDSARQKRRPAPTSFNLFRHVSPAPT